MKIISQIYNEEFDLPDAFEVEITISDYMIKDQGEQSTPVTLPLTPKNMRLLDFKWRLDSAYKPVVDNDVFVQDGLFNRKAILSINNASYKDGINCTLYFNRSLFYSTVEDKYLKDISIPEIKSPDYDNLTNTERVQYLIDLIKNEYMSGNASVFTAFPVVTDTDIIRKNTVTANAPNEEGKLILNNFDTDEIAYEQYPDSYDYIFSKFQGEKPQTYISDSVEISIPLGYGMTVFMNLYYVLEKLFDTYGYSFSSAVMRTGWTAFYPVLLNNIADAVCTGKIKPNELLPNVTIKAFIEYIEKRFAGKFEIDEENKTVSFKYYSTWFNTPPVDDLTKYLTSKIVMTGIEFQQMGIRDTSDQNFIEDKTVEYVDVDFEFPVKVSQRVYTDYYPDLTLEYKTFNLMNVGSVVNLYSKIVVDGVTKEENTDTSSDIMLVGARIAGGNYVEFELQKIWYRCGFASIDNYFNDPVGSLRMQYLSYFTFRENSNIPAKTTMKMPLVKFLSINISESYIFNGQKIFFEEIKYALPYDENLTVTLRTAKYYQ